VINLLRGKISLHGHLLGNEIADGREIKELYPVTLRVVSEATVAPRRRSNWDPQKGRERSK